MTKYHPNLSARSLTTTDNHLTQYPAHWELLRWYRCWRKYPYPSDVIAALMVEMRTDGYAHYPCPVDPTHWHIGRGGNGADPRKLLQRAKRSYRKAVRDELWREYERKQALVGIREEEERALV